MNAVTAIVSIDDHAIAERALCALSCVTARFAQERAHSEIVFIERRLASRSTRTDARLAALLGRIVLLACIDRESYRRLFEDLAREWGLRTEIATREGLLFLARLARELDGAPALSLAIDTGGVTTTNPDRSGRLSLLALEHMSRSHLARALVYGRR